MRCSPFDLFKFIASTLILTVKEFRFIASIVLTIPCGKAVLKFWTCFIIIFVIVHGSFNF